MKTTEFLGWLTDWLSRHPVRPPAETTPSDYADQVMRRVKTAGIVPAAAWRPQPQWFVAFGTVAAAIAVGFVVLTNSPERLSASLERDIEVLAEVDEEAIGSLLTSSVDGIAQELQLLNQMRLAELEEVVDEEAWLEETMELLNDVEGIDAASGPSGDDQSLEELLQELEQLDATESASS